MHSLIESGALLFASHNSNKVREIRELLAPQGFQITSAAELGLDAPEETEDSFLGNARIKAHMAARASGLPALSDDSGLCVDALGGAPGVWSADWAETPDGRDFALAMQKVHDALIDIQAPGPWTARFHTTLVLASPDGSEDVFEGDAHGRLVWPPRGDGFGYEPMFQPDGQSLTFAEMHLADKHNISHRARALAAFLRRYAVR